MDQQKLVKVLLRISIASVFLYAAVAATITPENWIWFIPQFLRNVFPSQLLLAGFSAYQVLLSLWILSGWKTFYAALLSSLTFIGIIAANFSDIDVLFRDFAIFFAALALAAATYQKQPKK